MEDSSFFSAPKRDSAKVRPLRLRLNRRRLRACLPPPQVRGNGTPFQRSEGREERGKSGTADREKVRSRSFRPPFSSGARSKKNRNFSFIPRIRCPNRLIEFGGGGVVVAPPDDKGRHFGGVGHATIGVLAQCLAAPLLSPSGLKAEIKWFRSRPPSSPPPPLSNAKAS